MVPEGLTVATIQFWDSGGWPRQLAPFPSKLPHPMQDFQSAFTLVCLMAFLAGFATCALMAATQKRRTRPAHDRCTAVDLQGRPPPARCCCCGGLIILEFNFGIDAIRRARQQPRRSDVPRRTRDPHPDSVNSTNPLPMSTRYPTRNSRAPRPKHSYCAS